MLPRRPEVALLPRPRAKGETADLTWGANRRSAATAHCRIGAASVVRREGRISPAVLS
jgi:hypothetical protein